MSRIQDWQVARSRARRTEHFSRIDSDSWSTSTAERLDAISEGHGDATAARASLDIMMVEAQVGSAERMGRQLLRATYALTLATIALVAATIALVLVAI